MLEKKPEYACKAIVFDLGRVVLDISFDRVFQSWALSAKEEFEYIKGNFRFNKAFKDFETGNISADMFRGRVMKLLKIDISKAQFDEGWCDLFLDAFPNIERLLAKLKCNYKLVAFSNTNTLHKKVWAEKYADTVQHFEKIFCSHELKARKPERKAFVQVLDYLQVKPGEIIFLDDSILNIEIADRLGLKTILVTSQKNIPRQLRSMNVIMN